MGFHVRLAVRHVELEIALSSFRDTVEAIKRFVWAPFSGVLAIRTFRFPSMYQGCGPSKNL